MKTYDFSTTEARINSATSSSVLKVLAHNILVSINYDTNSDFHALYVKASQKAKIAHFAERCPAPMYGADEAENALEEMAYNRNIESCARQNTMPSIRVITNQLSKLGYAKTAARQVERSTGGDKFQQMSKSGMVQYTSEYFIFRNARHLVDAKTLAKVDALFAEIKWAA